MNSVRKLGLKCRHQLFGLAIALLVISCSAETATDPTPSVATPVPEASATSTPSALPEPAPTPRRPEANPFPSDLRATAEGLLAEILAARGEAAEADVEMFLLTRDQARAFYSGADRQEEPGSPSPIDAKREIYVLLGLVPAEDDLRESEIDNLISFITGFYSPPLRALYVLETISGGPDGPLALSTIVHELTHALQYQNHPIAQQAAARAGNWDAITALQDVLEGDAVAMEIEVLGFSTRSTYRLPVCFSIPPPQRSVPFVVERELDTWYEDGLCFVQAVQANAGIGIEDILEDPPSTTEQILHPEKYLSGEGAAPVTLGSLTPDLGPAWRLVEANTFGEFTLQNILQPGLPRDLGLVQAAAAGWGGDGLRLYTDDEALLLHAEIVWDTRADALEFWQALAQSLSNRPELTVSYASESCLVAESGSGVLWKAQTQTQDVTLVVSDKAEAMDALAALFPACPTS